MSQVPAPATGAALIAALGVPLDPNPAPAPPAAPPLNETTAKVFADQLAALQKTQKELRIATLHDSGLTWRAEGRLDKAKACYTEALTKLQALHGDQPSALKASCLHNLGVVWHTLGDLEQAKKLYTEALVMKRKLYPNQPHSETANSLNNLGLVYKKLGEPEKARKYLHEAVEVSRKAVGENHAETKKFKMNLEGCQPSICTTQ